MSFTGNYLTAQEALQFGLVNKVVPPEELQAVAEKLANDIIKEAKVRLTKYPWPAGYSYAFTGEQEEQRETQAFLTKAFFAAIFIIINRFLNRVIKKQSGMINREWKERAEPGCKY
jgi:enoyl-CoA hydratase/carnithine racemase